MSTLSPFAYVTNVCRWELTSTSSTSGSSIHRCNGPNANSSANTARRNSPSTAGDSGGSPARSRAWDTTASSRVNSSPTTSSWPNTSRSKPTRSPGSSSVRAASISSDNNPATRSANTAPAARPRPQPTRPSSTRPSPSHPRHWDLAGRSGTEPDLRGDRPSGPQQPRPAQQPSTDTPARQRRSRDRIIGQTQGRHEPFRAAEKPGDLVDRVRFVADQQPRPCPPAGPRARRSAPQHGPSRGRGAIRRARLADRHHHQPGLGHHRRQRRGDWWPQSANTGPSNADRVGTSRTAASRTAAVASVARTGATSTANPAAVAGCALRSVGHAPDGAADTADARPGDWEMSSHAARSPPDGSSSATNTSSAAGHRQTQRQHRCRRRVADHRDHRHDPPPDGAPVGSNRTTFVRSAAATPGRVPGRDLDRDRHLRRPDPGGEPGNPTVTPSTSTIDLFAATRTRRTRDRSRNPTGTSPAGTTTATTADPAATSGPGCNDSAANSVPATIRTFAYEPTTAGRSAGGHRPERAIRPDLHHHEIRCRNLGRRQGRRGPTPARGTCRSTRGRPRDSPTPPTPPPECPPPTGHEHATPTPPAPAGTVPASGSVERAFRQRLHHRLALHTNRLNLTHPIGHPDRTPRLTQITRRPIRADPRRRPHQRHLAAKPVARRTRTCAHTAPHPHDPQTAATPPNGTHTTVAEPSPGDHSTRTTRAVAVADRPSTCAVAVTTPGSSTASHVSKFTQPPTAGSGDNNGVGLGSLARTSSNAIPPRSCDRRPPAPTRTGRHPHRSGTTTTTTRPARHDGTPRSHPAPPSPSGPPPTTPYTPPPAQDPQHHHQAHHRPPRRRLRLSRVPRSLRSRPLTLRSLPPRRALQSALQRRGA